MAILDPIDVPCQSCGASGGESCINVSGAEMRSFHVPRTYWARWAVVACPSCRVGASLPCISRNGQTKNEAHIVRLRLVLGQGA